MIAYVVASHVFSSTVESSSAAESYKNIYSAFSFIVDAFFLHCVYRQDGRDGIGEKGGMGAREGQGVESLSARVHGRTKHTGGRGSRLGAQN